MSSYVSKRGLLKDVALLRPILIVLLVFYHAFAPFSGVWAPIDGFPDVPIYWWLDKLSNACMLELFVFVSGYVFGFQVRTKGEERLQAKTMFFGKFKRLIIPCILFSLLYLILLLDIKQPVGRTFYDLINGVGHLWFLPMLFWCFVCVWLFERLMIKPVVALLGCFLLSIVSIVTLPLQLGSTFYYLFFFYAGYIIQRNDLSLNRINQTGTILVLLFSFFVLFPTMTLVSESVSDRLCFVNNQIVEKIITGLIRRICRIIYTTVGLALMISVVRGVLRHISTEDLPKWVINLGGQCMGVYLFQQFILKYIYNFTSLPEMLGPYCLPWVGFLIALFVSLLISFLLNQSRIGRFMMGT